MKAKITVLGGGSWGTALSKLLCENGGSVVKVWLRDEAQCSILSQKRINDRYLPGVRLPDEIKFMSDINEALSDADIILTVIPTQQIRGVFKQIDKKYKKNKIIVNASKGIEVGTLNKISDIVAQETDGCTYAVLSGPSHAEEVALRMPTAVTVASENQHIAKLIQDLFMTAYFRIYTNTDVTGAELGGALKNIIALGAGISDGIGYGDNAKAALMNRGIVEIARLGTALGADSRTFSGLSGIGDLIVTCTSHHSRNWNAGNYMGQGMSREDAVKKVGMVVEGITTTYAAYELAKDKSVEMPIVCAMYDVLENSANVKETVMGLMLREKKDEKFE